MFGFYYQRELAEVAWNRVQWWTLVLAVLKLPIYTRDRLFSYLRILSSIDNLVLVMLHSNATDSELSSGEFPY
jgi:hypothetical protein